MEVPKCLKNINWHSIQSRLAIVWALELLILIALTVAAINDDGLTGTIAIVATSVFLIWFIIPRILALIGINKEDPRLIFPAVITILFGLFCIVIMLVILTFFFIFYITDLLSNDFVRKLDFTYVSASFSMMIAFITLIIAFCTLSCDLVIIANCRKNFMEMPLPTLNPDAEAKNQTVLVMNSQQPINIKIHPSS